MDQETTLEAGFASCDITPAIGAEIPGGFSPRTSESVLDPLAISTCVLHNRDKTFALLAVDAVSLSSTTTDAIRLSIAKASNIARENIVIAASHTHSGGPANSVLGTDADPEYLAALAGRATESVTAALKRLQPVRCIVGRGTVEGWSYNRRFRMKSGGVATNPKYGDPDIIEPEGPADPEIGLVGIQAPDGTPLGAIASFACHPGVISGKRFSADFPGFWRTALREKLHKDFTLIFLNGACGNIRADNAAESAPVDPSETRAEKMGADLAAETIRLMEPPGKTDVMLSAIHGGVTVDYRRPDRATLDAAEKLLAQPELVWNREAWVARDRVLLARELGETRTVDCPVSVLQIGEAAIVAIPWQPFSEFGLEIKHAVPEKTVLLATFANGSLGYVPTPEAFENGGYEPVLCRGSRLSPDAGARITGEAIRLLHSV